MLLVNDKSTSERCLRHHRSLLWMLVNSGKRAAPVSTHQEMNGEPRRGRMGGARGGYGAGDETVCDFLFRQPSLRLIWPVR